MKCPKCQADNPETKQFCGDCGTQLTPPAEAQPSFTKTIETAQEELATGSVFADRYQVIEELGKGGMGKVYRVLDKKLNEEVALKLIKPDIASDRKTLERFKNELKLARKVVQKNVGRMFDLGEETGTHYITMEYVPGEDLKSFIRRVGQIPVGKSLSIAKQLCEGLSEAHDIGIVHRDLKPSNIMIDKDGNARIMDFGIARSMEAKKLTGAGVIIGTPEYMSPEQVEGKETDQRSDIYSLGVILYEMLTGRLPFEGDTPLSIAVQHRSDTPKDPKDFNGQIPEDLSTAILRCLAKDKGARYQSAKELLSSLSQIEKTVPTTTGETAAKKPLTSREITVSLSMKKIFVPALFILAIAVIALLLWRPWGKETIAPIPTDRPSLAILYFENNTGDENLDNWRGGLCNLLITDMGQSKYVHPISGARIYGTLEKLGLLEKPRYSANDLNRVASQLGVSHILHGSYLAPGDKFIINLSLSRADSGAIIHRARYEGTEEEISSSLIDKITREVKSALDLTAEQIEGDIDKSVGQITTHYQQALVFYLEGWKYHLAGNYEKVIECLEKAVALDPAFAMAHRTMAWAYLLSYDLERSKQHIQKAFDLTLDERDRISEREFYLIQADYYGWTRKNWGKSIEVYQRLLEIYPDDFLGRLNLGDKYRAIEEWDKAIECYESLTKYKDNSAAFARLSHAYSLLGDSDKQKDVLEDWGRSIPDDPMIYWQESTYYRDLGEFDKALKAIEKALAADPNNFSFTISKGFLYFVKGDLAKAREEFLKLQNQGTELLQGLSVYALIDLYTLQGQFQKAAQIVEFLLEFVQQMNQEAFESMFHAVFMKLHYESGDMEAALKENEAALETVDKVVEALPGIPRPGLSNKMGILCGKGLMKAEMGLVEEALEAAERLKGLIEEDLNQKLIRFYYHLLGRIELVEENYPRAIEYFEEALSYIPPGGVRIAGHGRFTDSLALAYYQSGELEKARDVYEKNASLMGLMDSNVIFVKTFYMLGKVHEGLGSKQEAIENYEKFLDLWKDGDPGIVEVEDAKKRLARLKEK